MRWFSCLVLAALIISPIAAHSATRGSAAEISRALNAHKRDPGNAVALTDLGSQFALRASEQGFPTDVEDARNYLRMSLKMDPNNAQTVAWLGALRCIEAKVRQTKGYVKDGLNQLDHAVEMSPDDIVVRLVRGSVAIEVPRDFGRLDTGIADLEIVLAAYEREPAVLSSRRIDATELFLKLGKGYRAKGNMENAKQMWGKAAEGHPGKERDAAIKLLAKYAPAKR
jgi:tetratricopeptide (TPR) repeat protein